MNGKDIKHLHNTRTSEEGRCAMNIGEITGKAVTEGSMAQRNQKFPMRYQIPKLVLGCM